jgi:predicted transposase/invertase (TIGR01784 family)
MANKDIVSKQALSHLAGDIANLLLNLDVDLNSVELLDTEQQRVELRRADLVARMQKRDNQDPFILHVEIQNSNQADMAGRMLRYFSDIYLQYPKEPIHQHLVYIGKKPFSMPTEIVQPQFTYRYAVLDMHMVDCSILLAQDTPDALVLAILCDFKQHPVQDVVNYIVGRLKELTGDDESRFRNYFEMLETLADNRDLQPQLDEAKQMLTQVNVKKFASYKWGLQDGLLQGIEQGIERGMERGIERGTLLGEKRRAREVALWLLALGTLESTQIAEIAGLPLQELEYLQNERLN